MKKTTTDKHLGNRKVYDTMYKQKVRILLNHDFQKESFELQDIVGYIFDEKLLHYFSCENKNCFFGTDRYDRFQRHVNSCTTETTVKYKQIKKGKPDCQIRRELAAEGILPHENFQNEFFATYDIG